jgi:hypothetical protein
MTTPYKASYAFGLVVGKLGEHESIWHNGATVNAHSMLMRYVPQRLTIAVAGNTEGFPAELVAARSARIVSATLPPLDPRAFPEPQLRRNGLAGLIGVFLPLLTLLIAHAAWWRWVLAPLATVLLAAAGVIAPLYVGIAGLVIALLLLITPLRAVASRRRTPSDLSAAQH